MVSSDPVGASASIRQGHMCVLAQSAVRLQNCSGLRTKVSTLQLQILDGRLACVVVDNSATSAPASFWTTWQRSTPKPRALSAIKEMVGCG